MSNSPQFRDRDEDTEWAAYDRLPRALRHYLSEESPVDFSSEEARDALDDRGIDFLIRRLRMEAVFVLNDERPPHWPVATLYNTRPIVRRRQVRRAGLR